MARHQPQDEQTDEPRRDIPGEGRRRRARRCEAWRRFRGCDALRLRRRGSIGAGRVRELATKRYEVPIGANWQTRNALDVAIPLPVSETLVASGLAATVLLFALIKNPSDDSSTP
jgi:hypothetical protein